MTPLKVVTLTTPDGVSREMRDTPGARKRIFDRYGEPNFIEIARSKGDWALFEVAYLMMYDRKGKPPEGLSLDEFMETASASSRTELLAAIMSAVSNGEKSKNELEALLTQAEKSIGSVSGVSAGSVSDSASESSGGVTAGPNSMLESTAIESESSL
jgi:hypothetical protein